MTSDELTVAHAADPEDEAEQDAGGVERARGELADVVDDVQQGCWYNVYVVHAPHFALQLGGRPAFLVRA